MYYVLFYILRGCLYGNRSWNFIRDKKAGKKKKKKLVWQQRFLYPLLFQDDLYAIAYNHSLNEFNLKKNRKL